jgi:hypothetical protein
MTPCRWSATVPTATVSGCTPPRAPFGLTTGASAEDLSRALEGKELASGTLVATYQR